MDYYLERHDECLEGGDHIDLYWLDLQHLQVWTCSLAGSKPLSTHGSIDLHAASSCRFRIAATASIILMSVGIN